MFLKSSTLASHRRHGQKNTPPFRNLTASSTDLLLSLVIWSKCYETTMDYIMVNSEVFNLTNGTVKSISGNDIASENE